MEGQTALSSFADSISPRVVLRLGWRLAILLAAASQGLAAEVEFKVSEPTGLARSGWPVTSGIPLAAGELADAETTALFDEHGREVPLQTEALARWPDGSVRWLLLDFQVDLDPHETRKYQLRHDPEVQRDDVADPIAVENSESQIALQTGALRVVLSGDEFRLLDAVWFDRNGDGTFEDTERLTTGADAGIVLRTPDGEEFRADLARATLAVEQSGPIRACVRIEGRHRSERGEMFGYVVRLHAYRNQPFIKLHYTFINDHQPDLMTKVDSLELVFRAAGANERVSILDGQHVDSGRLYQVDDRSYEIDGESAGKRAPGWTAVGDSQGGMAVGVREFWQNWPKSLETGSGLLTIGLCPQFPGGLYDDRPIKEECKLYYYLRDGAYSFKIGAARTHELWTVFFDGPPRIDELSEFYRSVDDPLLAQCSPEYVAATRAAGNLPPADHDRYGGYDRWLDGLFQMHLEDRSSVRESGMLNFGDWYNIKWDSWGNLEYDTARCFFQQYLRTGDRRYFDRASEAARHYIDVDVVHAVNEKLLEFGGSARMRPGHVWLHQVGHTGGYYGRYEDGKYHDEAPLIMTGPYQVGMYNWGHQWIGGAFDYYVLTGDRRALDVAVMTSNTIAADCPTRYSDHIRDLGWPFNLVIAAYEATGDKSYLQAADRQWELLKSHLDPELGWQVMLAYGHCSEQSTAGRCRGQNAYMLALTLSGLARYHRITQKAETLQALTIGLDQLIRECWSEQHKTFYLTSCTHTRDNPPPALCSVTALAAEAFAYESALTGDDEHRRIFREAFQTMMRAAFESLAAKEQQGQTGYSSMMFHFTPFGLSALEDD